MTSQHSYDLNNTFLDLLITRSTTDYIHTLTATYDLLDHFIVIAEIDLSIIQLTLSAFNEDIVKSELITNPKADLSQLCERYQTTLKTLLDKHAPVRSKSITH